MRRLFPLHAGSGTQVSIRPQECASADGVVCALSVYGVLPPFSHPPHPLPPPRALVGPVAPNYTAISFAPDAETGQRRYTAGAPVHFAIAGRDALQNDAIWSADVELSRSRRFSRTRVVANHLTWGPSPL